MTDGNKFWEQPDRLQFPEIIIGLVGAIGVDLKELEETIGRELDNYGYHSSPIKLSDYLKEILGKSNAANEAYNQRIERLMDQGNALRKLMKQQDAMALLAVVGIRQSRANRHRENNGTKATEKFYNEYPASPLTQEAYILHQLKTPQEVNLLRNVYGRAFFVMAGYSSTRTRIDVLAGKIADSQGDTARERYRELAERLNNRDQKERSSHSSVENLECDDHYIGQNVEDTYPEADVFVDCSSRRTMEMGVRRFLESLFGYPFHTPTKDEYGMFIAMAASRRSADLARQVGAAIATPDGSIVAIGCNEVPKAGGGMYWEEDANGNDYRDYRLGFDSSKKMRDRIVKEIYTKLSGSRGASEGNGTEDNKETSKEDRRSLLADNVGEEEFEERLRNAQITDVLEYGRSIHAEMAALMDAAHRGISIKGGTLYTTTFPCHMCGRHIIAAGIKRVVYIEPYPKSKIRELYRDSTSLEGESCMTEAVVFDPFIGIAPRRFLEFFDATKGSPRREGKEGNVPSWSFRSAKVRFDRIVASYIFIEIRCEKFLADRLNEIQGEINRYINDQGWKTDTSNDPQSSLMAWIRERQRATNNFEQILDLESLKAIIFPDVSKFDNTLDRGMTR